MAEAFTLFRVCTRGNLCRNHADIVENISQWTTRPILENFMFARCLFICRKGRNRKKWTKSPKRWDSLWALQHWWTKLESMLQRKSASTWVKSSAAEWGIATQWCPYSKRWSPKECWVSHTVHLPKTRTERVTIKSHNSKFLGSLFFFLEVFLFIGSFSGDKAKKGVFLYEEGKKTKKDNPDALELIKKYSLEPKLP